MKHLKDICLPEDALRKDAEQIRSSTINVRMTSDELEKLEIASEELCKTKSQIIREALIMYYEYWLD